MWNVFEVLLLFFLGLMWKINELCVNLREINGTYRYCFMKYFLIAGEASGDIHAAQIIKALGENDSEAEFCFLGGDLMAKCAGCAPVIHYRDMAFMGFVEVIKHLPQILRIMRKAKELVRDFKPDAVILVDYPSFNLKIARYAFELKIPVFYYISPKVWAWKEYRVKSIKKYVTRLYSILPFEPAFFAKHDYEVKYVGNPSVSEIDEILAKAPSQESFCVAHNLDASKPIISILPGSRRKEILNNLPEMLKATHSFPDYQVVISGAPGIEDKFYHTVIKTEGSYEIPPVVFDETYNLVKYSSASLVTSGTATLETAIIGTPQVVCYRMNANKIVHSIFAHILKVKYVSLPNLIADAPIVPELLLHHCTKENISAMLEPLLVHSPKRDAMIEGYAVMRRILGTNDSAKTAVIGMLKEIKSRK